MLFYIFITLYNPYDFLLQTGRRAFRDGSYMSQRDLHHITGARHYRKDRQRKLIAGLCIFICAACIITDAILIKDMIDRNAQVSTPTQSSASLSSPISSETSSILTDTSASTDTTTPSASVSNDDREKALSALKANVSSLLDTKEGRYSVYYLNLANGESFGCNEADPMVAASSIKIAYNTYLYKQAAEGKYTLDEEMSYNAAPYPEGDLETGTGTIQSSPDGTKYTLSALSKLSITISDNCATNMILRYLGGIDAVNDGFMAPISAVVNYRTPVSYTDYTGGAQSGRQRTCAQDLAFYAKNLYDLYSASPDQYQQLIDDLSTTEYTWGIPSGVPSGVQVAHKVGFNPTYGSNNDVGIVFAQEDYVLCVMTESASDLGAQETIAQVSKLVSDYLAALYA